MLTLEVIEKEINEIIAHGNNRNDIACLADLVVCRDALKNNVRTTIDATGSEFADCINGKCLSDILPCIIELMETLAVINPKLYASVLRKLREGE